jgi:quercetin dioxygenase-like cupin family protein
MLGAPLADPAFGLRTIYQRDLPFLRLDGWQMTAVEFTCPPGMSSPTHRHPGFVFGYVLDGSYRLRYRGGPDRVLSRGEMFYEASGQIHLPSASASLTKPTKVLALAFTKKGEAIAELL